MRGFPGGGRKEKGTIGRVTSQAMMEEGKPGDTFNRAKRAQRKIKPEKGDVTLKKVKEKG